MILQTTQLMGYLGDFSACRACRACRAWLPEGKYLYHVILLFLLAISHITVMHDYDIFTISNM